MRVLGADSGRAGVTFLGTERMDVLRFGPDPDDGDVVRYVTLGMSRTPMTEPTAVTRDLGGPRAELVLTLRGLHDSVLRALAVLAATPAVDGVVLGPGATVDLDAALWEDAAFTAVLVGDPGGPVPDLPLDDGAAPVRFLPVLPIHSAEAAYKRVHGAAALEEQWLRSGVDLRDPRRPVPPLARPA